MKNECQGKEPEIMWIEVTGKKGLRNSPETSAKILKQSRLDSYWLGAPVQTSNRFEALDKEEQLKNTDSPVDRVPKPPPIYVDRVNNIQPLTQLLNEFVGGTR